MGLPNTLPCKCMNPQCGISFYKPNPVSGIGTNSVFSGNTTSCPQCGQRAIYADWNTDDQGNFHIKDIFNFVNEFRDIEKLEALRTNLQAVNNTFSSKELSDTLVNVDSGFQKFENVLKSISSNNMKEFRNTLIAIVTLIIAYQTLVMTDANHDEDISLEREKFEYQKQQDKKNQDINNKENIEKEAIQERIKALELEFELFMAENNKPQRQQLKISKHKKLKGKERNKPCPCGSGLKAKKCYLNPAIHMANRG